MKRTRSFLVSAILLAVLVGMFLTSGAARAASSAPKIICGQWNVVSSPDPNALWNSLTGVAANSSTDVWAVGNIFGNSGGLLTLAEHYDGTQWSVVSTPNPGVGAQLNEVVAISANDVWAVGNFQDSNYVSHTLVEQWNGTSWSVVPSPDGSTQGAQLSGIAAISATDIWAVGNKYISGGNGKTLTEHWDGTQWSVVPSPNVKGAASDELSGVTVASSSTAWAVGTSTTGSTTSTLIEKWNGTKWKIVASPNPQNAYNQLNGVAAASSNSIWAAGYSIGNNGTQTLAEQWKNKQWNIVASPSPSAANVFLGIAASSTRDIWAVGSSGPFGSTQTLTEKWNGNKWAVVNSPTSGTLSVFNSVAVVPGTTDFWAVGNANINGVTNTLTAYYC